MSALAHIAVIILAAGRSTRMGAGNKLLADVNGRPMIRHAVEAALASQGKPVLVVIGHQAGAVREALAGLPIGFVENPCYAGGLSGSLRRGIDALPAGCEGALIVLGDMPQIARAHMDRLIAAFLPGSICVATHKGKRGNPVLWPAACFAEMRQLKGDVGARELMAVHAAQVREVDVGSEAIFADIDTPEALARLRREHSAG